MLVKRAMFLGLAALGTMLGASAQGDGGLAVSRLRCEYLSNPLGIDVPEPRLDWVVASPQRGQKQTAYHILVASTRAALDAGSGDLWDTGKVASEETAQIAYQGKPLASRAACYWKVRVWDRNDKVSAWSEAASWTMGLLAPQDWQGKWIGQRADDYPKQGDIPGPLFRKSFRLEAKPVHAIAYVAAMGYYELHLNGRRIGDDLCSPPVSDYNKRAYYATYDVTETVQPGKNCAGVWLGRGWFCREFPGVTHPGPIARVQLEITLENGQTLQLGSDETWKTHPGPVTATGRVQNGNLDGERFDACAVVPGWDTPELDDATWADPQLVQPANIVLCASMMQPNRITETIAPVSLKETAPGTYLFDFGRNLTGMIEFHLCGTPGKPVSLSLIERREKDSDEWVDYDQRDEYIPRTDGEEVFRNQFNYHAFRYVEVKGMTRPPKPGDIKALFLRTDYAERGSFSCSNDLLNRIYDTTMYTYRCVSAGGDTVDCPHRERLGYGGDSQITSRTALYAYDLGAMYTKWLANWRDVQDPATGALPNIAPNPHPAGGGPTWGAISVFLPWDLFLHYGDRRVLQQNYPMMKQYVAFLDSKSEKDQLKPFGDPQYGFLGDWVAPGHDQDFGPWSPEEWRTFFNNCFYALIVDQVGKTAALLGEAQDVAHYAEQARRLQRATHERYFKPETNGYVDGGQAYLAIALLAGVTPEALRPQVLKQLEHTIVETNQGHLDTGMHGSMFLLRCLNEARRDDLIFLVTNQKTYPGWGYIVDQGGTTMWERWDGEFSQIHSTLLAAGEWFPRGIGGIKPDAAQPGFKRVIIDPWPVGDLAWAKSRYDTIRGPVASEWRREAQRFLLDVEIPANATALVRMPARTAEAITESGKPAANSEGVGRITCSNGLAEIEVASGSYRFASE